MVDGNFQTPLDVCDYMVSLVPSGVQTILEPTPGEGNLVGQLKRDYIVVSPDEFWSVSGYFDAVVMNPPFSPMDVGYKIFYRVMEMTNVIIALMPWLILINSSKRALDIHNFGLVSVTHLPRAVFNGSRVQTCILKMVRGYQGQTEFCFYFR